jgi:hypothetical protein
MLLYYQEKEGKPKFVAPLGRKVCSAGYFSAAPFGSAVARCCSLPNTYATASPCRPRSVHAPPTEINPPLVCGLFCSLRRRASSPRLRSFCARLVAASFHFRARFAPFLPEPIRITLAASLSATGSAARSLASRAWSGARRRVAPRRVDCMRSGRANRGFAFRRARLAPLCGSPLPPKPAHSRNPLAATPPPR